MNKYLIIASDERSYLDLKNVVLELKKRKLPYFFLYNNSSERLSPQVSLDQFNYDTNVESNKQYPSKTLGFNLPFKPDVLLITNENWEPEKTIIHEFKHLGCFIGCIENSTWNFNNIKTKLEIASRKTFPSNCIDIFFDHSKWSLETKIEAGWWGQKSIVVGNPKHDDLILSNPQTGEDIIVVYGSMEIEHHNKILDIYKQLSNKYPKWEIYYKPHPSELIDFKDDFRNIKLISSQKEFNNILEKSKYNIGIFGSVMYLPLLMRKEVIILDFKSSGFNDELDIEKFKGHEFNFWKNILNFQNFEEFKTFISTEYIKNIIKRNKKLESILGENLAFYNKDIILGDKKSNNKDLLKYYDDFCDNNASKRIINYIEHGQ